MLPHCLNKDWMNKPHARCADTLSIKIFTTRSMPTYLSAAFELSDLVTVQNYSLTLFLKNFWVWIFDMHLSIPNNVHETCYRFLLCGTVLSWKPACPGTESMKLTWNITRESKITVNYYKLKWQRLKAFARLRNILVKAQTLGNNITWDGLKFHITSAYCKNPTGQDMKTWQSIEPPPNPSNLRTQK